MQAGDEVPTTPHPTLGRPSVEKLREAGRRKSSRVAAEEFALEFANYYVDVREKLDDRSILDEFTSKKFPASVAMFIESERNEQRKINTQRHLDPTIPPWVRSAAEGKAVAVEMAANGVAPGLDFRTWFKVRVDVVRVGDRWVASNLSTTVDGPSQTKRLTREQSRLFLGGSGWRELSP